MSSDSELEPGEIRSKDDSCYTCDTTSKETFAILELCQRRAARTAHFQSMIMMEPYLTKPTGFMRILGLEFVDWYTVYFRKIYEHEESRNRTIEFERIRYRSTKHARDHGLRLCKYHGEFDQEFCEAVYKTCETRYSRSKFPKHCESYQSKKLKQLFADMCPPRNGH